MYFGMLRATGIRDFSRLGGFVFTSPRPSPLTCMQISQAKRQLINQCFRCGGGHHAKNCQKLQEDGCDYRCNNCRSTIRISSRGQSVIIPAKSEASQRPVAPSAERSCTSGATRSSEPAAVPRPRSRTPTPAPSPGPVLRRPASASANFQHVVSPLTFEQCWGHASVRREGRYRCCKDVLAVMDTVQAGRAMATVKERVQTLAKQQHWPEGSWKQLPQFRGFKGAGSHGVGCTKRAMRDLYLKQGGQPDS